MFLDAAANEATGTAHNTFQRILSAAVTKQPPDTARKTLHDTNTTTNDPNSEPSPGIAAGKVFAIPELLELIFLELATDVSKSTASPTDKRLEPVQTLSIVRAVDRTFRDNIDGSSKLQNEITNSVFVSDSTISPTIDWLLYGRLGLEPHKSIFSGIMICGMSGNRKKPGVEAKSFCMQAAQSVANWGRVKVRPSCWGSVKASLVVKVVMEENIIGGYYFGHQKIRDDTTLGDFFGMATRLVIRSKEEHCEFYDESRVRREEVGLKAEQRRRMIREGAA